MHEWAKLTGRRRRGRLAGQGGPWAAARAAATTSPWSRRPGRVLAAASRPSAAAFRRCVLTPRPVAGPGLSGRARPAVGVTGGCCGRFPANDAIAVRLGTQVVGAHGTGRLEHLTLHDTQTGSTKTVPRQRCSS